MVQPFAQSLGEPEHLRHPALDQHVHVHRNAAFQLAYLEQRFHQQHRIDGARFRFDHHADVGCEFVADVGNKRQLAFVQKFRDALDQPRLLHQIRNLRHHDLVAAAAGVFLGPARPHPERSAAGGVGLRDRLLRIDHDAAGRKIRARHVFQKRLAACIRIVDHEQCGVAKLGGVVRRDRGRHADRDALRAVRQQIGKRTRQHHRLFRQPVIVRTEVDGVFVDAIEQEPRNLGHARFGVAIGRSIIAVDIAEIALPVDQRIAR